MTKTGAVLVSTSSLFAGVVDQPSTTRPDPDVVPVDLLTVLAAVPGPTSRSRSGPTISPLRCGCGWAWAGRCRARRTIRRLLQSVDAEELDRAVSAWLASRIAAGVSAGEPRRQVAIDGKTARGARCGEDRAVHLLAAFDTGTGTVLGQAVVDGKSNEINAFAPLLDRIELTGMLITADALHTRRAHVGYLRSRGAHYLLTVKANQPTLLAQLSGLPWADVPIADMTAGKGHGRLEQRIVKLTAVNAGIGFPDPALAVQITRRRKPLSSRRWQTETIHTITDLDYEQTSPVELADAARAHWGIENRLHWVRDVTFAEDLSQIRTGHGPAVMATLRNLAINLHRLTGASSIAAACRHLSHHPERILPLLT